MQNDNINNNLDFIANEIFKYQPGLKNSICLELEEESSFIAKEDGYENYIFNVLYLITIKGIKILYGHQNIMLLSEDEFKTVEKYVQSYGYDIIVNGNNTIFTPWQLLKNNIELKTVNISFQKTKL